MMTKIPARVHVAFLFLFTIFAFAESAVAQFRGGGGGRSRGGDRNSPFRVLFEDDYEREFNLTEDQRGKLEQLEEELRSAGGEQLDFRNLPQDETERAAYFAEMRKKGEARNAEAMGKIKSLLQENQYQRLEQLRYQRLGVAALGTEEVSADLKMSDAQKEQLSAMAQEYQAARMQMFRMRGEEREQAEQEWNDKFLAVLTPDQKTAWQTKLGPPPADEDDRSAPSATTTANSTPASAAPRGTYTPPEEEGPVVVSLAGPEGAESEETATAEKPGAAAVTEKDELIQFHLENAPWEMVLKRFAQKAGLTLQIMDLPPGSLTYTNDDRRYTPTEALDILHGYLLQKGFVMIKRDRFLVVLSIDGPGGIPPNLIPSISISDLDIEGKYGKHEIVSVVLPLEGAEANDAAREVESLKGPQGSVAPLSVSNSLVVTDTYSNVKRIHNLLKGVTNIDPEQQQFKSFPLNEILAEDAAIIVRDQLGLDLTSSSSSSRSRFSFGFPGSNNSSSSRSRTTSSNSPSPPEAKVTPDPRTNRLLVTATPNQLAIAEQILAEIDIEPRDGMDGRPVLRVYNLKLADTDEVQRTLDALMPGLVVGEDEDRTGGRLHVRATPRQHEQIAELIAKMDGAASLTSAVIPLRSYDPTAVTTMLNGLFYSDGDLAPTIMAESTGRRLIVRGSNEQIAEIRKFLSDLGEDGNGGSQDVDRGPLRMRSLGGRDPEEFARILEQVWGNRSERPVRVVIPSSKTIRDRVVPSLRDQTQYPFLDDDLRPSTNRAPRAADLDQKSTAVQRNPLYPVSLQDEKTEPAKAETAADKPAEKNEETKAGEDAAAGLPVFPAEVTLRITRAGDWLLNGKPTSAIELSKFASGWLKAVPKDERRFTFSTHPDTPTAVSFGALGVLQRSGVDPTLKMSADDGEAAANSQQSSANAGRQPSVATGSGQLPITLTIRGGDLMLFDPTGKSESLDEMEAIIEQLALAIPPRTTWTVYYLRSADCTETATMLEQLFPSSSVSDGNVGDDGSFFGGLTNSISSLGGSLVDAAGLNTLAANSSVLRIIPEIRSNSLFVSGPIDQVNQVEEMLRVLDADELPETLRDRVPRTIPVKYANVTDVYNQVKELYKDYMQDERQQQQGRNPLEMMMGGRSSGNNSRGGSSRGGSRGPSQVRMTLAVDTQTSELIVSASDALYQQVKQMVEERDLAAKQAERSVQIVSGVNEGNAVVLQQALTAMLPSVNVSTTSSSDSNRSSFGGDSQRPSWGSSGSSFDRSRFFNNSSGSSRPTFGGGDSGRTFGTSSRGGFGGGDSGRSSFGGSSRGGFGGGDSGRSSFGGSSRGGFGGGDSGRSFGGSSRGGSSGRSFGGRGR